jgi:hypothetical protein
MSESRIVGGLLTRHGGRLFATSVRHEIGLRPVCWRCANALYLDTATLAPGDSDAHPWVWTCPGCVTGDDEAMRDKPEGLGVL